MDANGQGSLHGGNLTLWVRMLTTEKTTEVPVKEESCVVDVSIVESSKLVVHVEKPTEVEVHAMVMSAVEKGHKNQGKKGHTNDAKLMMTGNHAMRVQLLMFSNCSRLVVQVEKHILEVLMINKPARMVGQFKKSMVLDKESTAGLTVKIKFFVDIGILWAVDEVQKDPDKRGHTDEDTKRMNIVNHMRVELLMFSKHSRWVGQVKNHTVEVLRIDKSARSLVQLKCSMSAHKVKKDPDKRKGMDGCFGYQVDPKNIYMEKGAKTKEERKHRRR